MGSGPANGLNSPVSGEPTQAFSPRPCPGSPSPSPLGIQIGSPFRAQLDRQLRRTDSRSPAWTPPRPALRGEDPGPLAVTGREQRPPGGARGAGRARRRRGASEESEGPPPARLTVDVLPVADVLQVAARVLAAQVGVGPAGLQPRVGIPAELGAGRHAARGGVPHGWRPGPGAAPGQQRRRRRGLAMGGPAPLARPGGLSAAEERPRPRDCGRPARLTPPPPWRAPRNLLRFPIGPALRRRPQAVPVQGARPLGMRRRGGESRRRGRKQAAGTRAAVGDGNAGGREARRWARAWAARGTLGPGPAPRALRAPPTCWSGPAPLPAHPWAAPPSAASAPRPPGLAPPSALEADAEEGVASRACAPAVQWCREEPAQGREVRAAPGPLAAVDGSRGGGRGIFFSPPLNSQRLELMGRVGALSRPEPPVVCPECTLGRGGAALPAGLSSGAPGSPVHPTTQSAVGARTLQGGPHPATHPHTHGSTAPLPLGRTK